MRYSQIEAHRDHADVQIQATIFVRMNVVVRMTGLSRSTIYRLIATKKFPFPVRLASRAVAWRSTDLDRWNQERPIATLAQLRR